MRFATVALLVLLAACGRGADEPSAPQSTTPAVASGIVQTTLTPSGDPAPEALSQFRCEPDGTGTYTASGVLANDAKTATTFQVTVHVGVPIDGQQPAKTKQVPKVAGGGSVDFKVFKVPAAGDGPTCHVQVLKTK